MLSNPEDPELQRLARALPASVLSSKADSNTKKYLGASHTSDERPGLTQDKECQAS